MNKIFTFFLVVCGWLNTLGQGVDTLLFNGPVENRINLVILGDGYREEELPDFITDATNTLQALFEQTPFKEYKNYFNAFAIQTASEESGAALSPNRLIKNYYGSTFNYGGIERLLVPTQNDVILEVLANNFPLYDQVLMIVNDTKYGGSGGWIATASTHNASVEIMIHELGHSFGLLSDEYWAGAQYASETANMTKQSSPQLVRWKNWVGDNGIGVIKFSEDKTWHKPHLNCKMQYLGSPFCAVCTEALIHRVHQLTNFIESYSPARDALQLVNEFDVSLLKPVPNTLKIKWSFNDGTLPDKDEHLTLSQSELASLPDTIFFEVMDTTELSRRDQIFITEIEWILHSDIKSEITKYFLPRPSNQPPITGTPDDILAASSLYPNPYHDQVTIDYTLQKPQQVKIRVVDFSGRVIGSSDLFQPAGKHRFESRIGGLKTAIVRLYINDRWENFKVFRDH